MKKETSAEVKAPPPKTAEPVGKETGDNGDPSGIRVASREQFEKAQRKTTSKHAGLFRRLAK